MKTARRHYRESISQLNDDELDNEQYTYEHERHTVSQDDDEVADRLIDIELEKGKRVCL